MRKVVDVFSHFGNLLQLGSSCRKKISICFLVSTHTANKSLQLVDGRYTSYISACVGLRPLTNTGLLVERNTQSKVEEMFEMYHQTASMIKALELGVLTEIGMESYKVYIWTAPQLIKYV